MFFNILSICNVLNVIDFVFLIYYVIMLEKVPVLVLGFFKVTDFYFKMFYFANYPEILPARTLLSKFANFGRNIISIDGVMTSQI